MDPEHAISSFERIADKWGFSAAIFLVFVIGLAVFARVSWLWFSGWFLPRLEKWVGIYLQTLERTHETLRSAATTSVEMQRTALAGQADMHTTMKGQQLILDGLAQSLSGIGKPPFCALHGNEDAKDFFARKRVQKKLIHERELKISAASAAGSTTTPEEPAS